MLDFWVWLQECYSRPALLFKQQLLVQVLGEFLSNVFLSISMHFCIVCVKLSSWYGKNKGTCCIIH